MRYTDASYDIPVGHVGEPYSHQFAGEGGCGPALPYQWRILQGEMPPGLSLNGATGLVSGTPTQVGSWAVWIELSDQDPPTADWCRPAKSEREFVFPIEAGTTPIPPEPPDEGGDVEKIGTQHGVTAAVNRLRDMDPGGTLLKKDSKGKWPPISSLTQPVNEWKAYDKLERTLGILVADHDEMLNT